MKLFARLLHRCDGAVAIEMGLVTPIVFILLVGIHDFGRVFVDQMALQHATQAGTVFAFHKYNKNGNVTQGEIQAAANASTDSHTVTIQLVDGGGISTDEPWNGCPEVDGLVVQVTPTGSCPDTGLGKYLTVIGETPTQSLLLGTTLWPRPSVFPDRLRHSITIRLK